jgi:hypothetical protein
MMRTNMKREAESRRLYLHAKAHGSVWLGADGKSTSLVGWAGIRGSARSVMLAPINVAASRNSSW